MTRIAEKSSANEAPEKGEGLDLGGHQGQDEGIHHTHNLCISPIHLIFLHVTMSAQGSLPHLCMSSTQSPNSLLRLLRFAPVVLLTSEAARQAITIICAMADTLVRPAYNGGSWEPSSKKVFELQYSF